MASSSDVSMQDSGSGDIGAASATPPPIASASSPSPTDHAASSFLSAPDSLLEPGAWSALQSFLTSPPPDVAAQASADPMAAPRTAIRLMSEGYRGRTDMIKLVSQWMEMAEGNGQRQADTEQKQTGSLSSTSSSLSSSPSVSSILSSCIQRHLEHRFDTSIADSMLARSNTTPPWLDAMLSPEAGQRWAGLFASLAAKYPKSLLLKFCLRSLQQNASQAAASIEAGSLTSPVGGKGAGGEGGVNGAVAGAESGLPSILTPTLLSRCMTDIRTMQSVLHAIVEEMLRKLQAERGRSSATSASKAAMGSSVIQREATSGHKRKREGVKLEEEEIEHKTAGDSTAKKDSDDSEMTDVDPAQPASRTDISILPLSSILDPAQVSLFESPRMSVEALRLDLARLAAHAEHIYIYTQRVLNALYSRIMQRQVQRNVNKQQQSIPPAACMVRRLMQDIRTHAARSTPTPLLNSMSINGTRTLHSGTTKESLGASLTTSSSPQPPLASPTAAAAASAAVGNDTGNSAAGAIDLFISSIPPAWSDVYASLRVLQRKGSLLPVDVAKLYARYAPALRAPGSNTAATSQPNHGVPPVILLRDRELLQDIFLQLFQSDSKLREPPAAHEIESDTAFDSAIAAATSGIPSSPSPLPSISLDSISPAQDRRKYIFLLAYASAAIDMRPCPPLTQQRRGKPKAEQDGGYGAIAGAAAAATINSAPSPAQPIASSSSATIDVSRVLPCYHVFLRFHELAISSSRDWIQRPSKLVRLLFDHVPTQPLLAAGALLWLRDVLTSQPFWESTHYTALAPYLHNLIGLITPHHPLLRHAVWSCLKDLFHFTPSAVDALSLVQHRKTLLTLMLHLLHTGFDLVAITSFVLHQVRSNGLDHALLRHFIVGLISSTAPPYSRAFVEQAMALLAEEATFKALQVMIETKVMRKGSSSATAGMVAGMTGGAVARLAAQVKHILAQARIPAGTPAARRYIRQAESNGTLPAGTLKQIEEAQRKEEEAAKEAAAEPSRKKSKTESGTNAASPSEENGDSLPSLSPIESPPPAPIQPKSLAAAASADAYDDGEESVLHFCAYLASDPDRRIRHSSDVRGFIVDAPGILVTDECETTQQTLRSSDTDTGRSHDARSSTRPGMPPLDETLVQHFLQTCHRYLRIRSL